MCVCVLCVCCVCVCVCVSYGVCVCVSLSRVRARLNKKQQAAQRQHTFKHLAMVLQQCFDTATLGFQFLQPLPSKQLSHILQVQLT